MAKSNEIEYIKQVAKVENIKEEDFANYLASKPFSDQRCGDYLMDIAQIMNLLPPPSETTGCWRRKRLDQRFIRIKGLRSPWIGHQP